jgi:predicted dehydrogenase
MPTRRDFLTGSAAVLAAAALTPLTRAQDAPPAAAPADGKKLGWGIVAIGSLSKNQILPALDKCQKSKLAALVTGHPEKAKPYIDAGLDPACVYSYDTFDKLADNPAVDILYIVLPNGMHMDYTVRGVKAGKHVLCEKPMANNSADCQTMIDAAKSAGKKLMIAYRMRREPNTLQAIQMYKDKVFGDPQLIIADHGFNIAPNVWRLDKKLAGGGPIYDIGIYSLNASRYLSGEEPIAVTAQLTENPNDPRFAEVEQSMVWTLKFPSGVLATGSTGYNIRGTNRVRVVCQKGMIDMEPATAYHNNRMRAPGLITNPDIDQFAAEIDYFSDCVMNNTDPITPGEEGLRDIKIIEAMYQSARTGQTVSLV